MTLPISRRYALAACLLAVSILAWPARAAALAYSVIDLGSLIGPGASAVAINDNGQIIGNTSAGPYIYNYPSAQLTNIGPLLGSATQSFAAGLSSNGLVVGNTASGIFTYSSATNTATNLGSFGLSQPFATGINASGQICGYANGSSSFGGYGYGWYYSAGTTKAIDNNPNNFPEDGAAAINNSGQIAGNSTNGAYVYKIGGTLTNIQGNNSSYPYPAAINAAGDVTGYDENFRAFLSTGGAPLNELPPPPGAYGYTQNGNALNATDEVVGVMYTSDGGYTAHAFVYTPAIGIQDLNNFIPVNSGWTLQYANGVNDLGWIIGSGTNSEDQADSYLLIPIPEPSTIAVSSTLLLALLRRPIRQPQSRQPALPTP